jgi:methylated-DNA-[protein]-cysteine S-methyltransferase
MTQLSTSVDTSGFGYLNATSLGWMAFWFQGGALRELSFGHAQPDEAWASVIWSEPPRVGCDPLELSQAPGMVSDVVDRLARYAEGAEDDLSDIRLEDSDFSEFRRRVTEACRRIPYGATVTYGELAARVGAPGAARAVGNVMRTNRWPLVVPCHRVIASSGKLGGYSAPSGLTMKQRLLQLEASSLGATRADSASGLLHAAAGR